MRYQTSVLSALVAFALHAGSDAPALRPSVDYFEAECFTGPWAVGSEQDGFFGTGYRAAKPNGQPSAIDRTVFVFGRHKGGPKHIVWVRALAEANRDRRVAVEIVGQTSRARLEPTHSKPEASGFRWQRAGQYGVKEVDGGGRCWRNE